ncbi:MAG: pyruvate kinase [Thermoanaerobaculia bacterium]
MPVELTRQGLKKRRTKIVATIGPASCDPGVVERLILAGADVFRLNMSHGDHDSHTLAYRIVREAAERLRRPIAVFADLCGPKIRCGTFKEGSIELASGSRVVVTTRDVPGDQGLIPSQYEPLARDVSPGNHILLDDGNLELVVASIEGTEIACDVIQGGTLKNRKGMNLPDVAVSAASFTPKDRDDAEFAIALGVDLLALSFVRRRSDVDELRELVNASGRAVPIISKIEKPEALREIDAITDASDALMVARGDLGVELPAETVPIVQGQLIDLAREKARPVIVATQMLESMVTNARPTRAEVSDVSTAVMHGADAVMLSAETASGAFPVKAVETMDRVARETEGWLWREGAFGTIGDHAPAHAPIPLRDAIARATAQLSRDLLVRAIFVITQGGTSARMVSAARPAAPVLAVSASPAACRVMNLLWGVVPVLVSENDLDQPHELARRLVAEHELASDGDAVLRVSGFHPLPERSIPTISVLTV